MYLLVLFFLTVRCSVLSSALHGKESRKADDAASSLSIYVVMVILLIVVETIIGTPLQNWICTIWEGHTKARC